MTLAVLITRRKIIGIFGGGHIEGSNACLPDPGGSGAVYQGQSGSIQLSLNSSKSNRLPRWDPFFIGFAKNQFTMYQMVHEQPGLRKLFEACYRDNLHSIWAGQELYRPGNTKEVFANILQKNMQPVYDSARRQGYEIWDYVDHRSPA